MQSVYVMVYSCVCDALFCLQWLSDCCGNVAALGVFGDKTPNHVLVNEYAPGQGIMVNAVHKTEYNKIQLFFEKCLLLLVLQAA